MKKFATYLFVVLLATAALDGLNRILVEFALNNLPSDSELRRMYRYVSKSDSELLIIGASRGVYDYNTSIITDSLNVTCQSISMEGMSTVSQYVAVNNAITNGKVDVVLYDLSAAQLSDDWVENQMSSYYPFYWQNEDIKTFVEDMQGKKMRLILLSSFIQYNSSLYDIIYTGYVVKTEDVNGYIALPYTGEKFVARPAFNVNHPLKINPIAECYLQKIVDLCKTRNIRLILCDSPRVNHFNQSFDSYLADFAEKNEIEFWNYSDYEPVVSDMRFFVDRVHINERGADIFTDAIIHRFKENSHVF